MQYCRVNLGLHGQSKQGKVRGEGHQHRQFCCLDHRSTTSTPTVRIIIPLIHGIDGNGLFRSGSKAKGDSNRGPSIVIPACYR